MSDKYIRIDIEVTSNAPAFTVREMRDVTLNDKGEPGGYFDGCGGYRFRAVLDKVIDESSVGSWFRLIRYLKNPTEKAVRSAKLELIGLASQKVERLEAEARDRRAKLGKLIYELHKQEARER